MAHRQHHHHHDPPSRQNTNTRSGSNSGAIIIEAIPPEEKERRKELISMYNQHIDEIINDAEDDTSGHDWNSAIKELKRLRTENTLRRVDDPNFKTGAYTSRKRVYSVLYQNIQKRKEIFKADPTKRDPSGAIWQMAERKAFEKMT